MSVEPLAGFTIGITAARRREELGTALARRGARVIYGPAIRIVPLADDASLLAATRRCLETRLDGVVATTGIGFRGWMDAAETWGLAEPLSAALAAATILARGPKARGAVRATGLREAWSPDSESSDEVLAHLLAGGDLAGKRVAVQLHGEPLRDLVDGLRGIGAEVIEVPVYRWVQPDDEAPLQRLIEETAAGGIDALAFTSAPAAVNFLRTAQRLGIAVPRDGSVLCACVGPVTAGPLRAAGIPVVMPDRGRLGALARTIVEHLPARAHGLTAAGRRLELRGSAVLVDGRLIELPTAGMALLRSLAGGGGRVLSRPDLLGLLPGESSDGHAVEMAVGRLRAALGDPAIIQTVVKRGYRLRVGAA
ncbi:MAG: uroporphyrinogen-III synthase [Mycobacteriales bacterium]